jgi:hypothetical protein
MKALLTPFLCLMMIGAVGAEQESEGASRWFLSYGGFVRGRAEHWGFENGDGKFVERRDLVARFLPHLWTHGFWSRFLPSEICHLSQKHIHLVFPYFLAPRMRADSPEQGGRVRLDGRPDWIPEWIQGVQLDFREGIEPPDVIWICNGPGGWTLTWSRRGD